MPRIVEVIQEPRPVYKGDIFKLRIKLMTGFSYNELKLMTYNQVKDYTYNEIKGEN